MKTLFAFTKKEWMEQIRSGKLVILGILFVLLGIMNPAVAKLTPWMMEMMEDSLAEAGMIVTDVNVDAMTSWTQFFKNIPMGLIAFVLIESSIFTKEYESGTLILALTKGLERYKVFVSKGIILAILWTICYWICYGITYFYNDFYWDNSILHNLTFSAVCWWILGIMAVALVLFFSALGDNNTIVLFGTGGMFLASYLIGLFPKLSKYVPTMLMNAASLLTGVIEQDTYGKAIVITICISIICIVVGISAMNKRQMV